MRNHQPNLPQQILFGIVLAAVLLPAPVQAQWTVFDPAGLIGGHRHD